MHINEYQKEGLHHRSERGVSSCFKKMKELDAKKIMLRLGVSKNFENDVLHGAR